MTPTPNNAGRPAAVEALRELVACKDLKDSISKFPSRWPFPTPESAEQEAIRQEYAHRQPLAWAAARAALAQPPEAPAARLAPDGGEVSRLDKSMPLDLNLRALANQPQASIDAFGIEWAGWCAASALDALAAIPTSAPTEWRCYDGKPCPSQADCEEFDFCGREPKTKVVAIDPGRERQIGITDIGDDEFRQWIRKAYRDHDALDAIYSLWNMQVAFKAGWKQALASTASTPASEPAGLSIAQEPKYTVNGSAIVNRASGESIPADEPVFIFRARDRHATEVLEFYRDIVTNSAHREAIDKRTGHFYVFKNANPWRMKEPDTAATPSPTASASEPTSMQVSRLAHDEAPIDKRWYIDRSPSSASADDYVGARLRLVCKLAGVPVPDGDDKQIAECAFTLLGTVRAALERANVALSNSLGLTIAQIADPREAASASVRGLATEASEEDSAWKYRLNMLESCANWLESRSRCVTLNVKADPEEGGGYESLMRRYAEDLRTIRAHLARSAPAATEAMGEGATGGRPNYFNWNLHPRTADLVLRFSYALAGKLAAAEKKYGYSDGWAESDWLDECREKLMEHIEKGDPRDVAAYCAFLWHHGASTAGAKPSMHTIADLAEVFDEGVRNGAALSRPATPAEPVARLRRYKTAEGHEHWEFVGNRYPFFDLPHGEYALSVGSVSADAQKAVAREPLTEEQLFRLIEQSDAPYRKPVQQENRFTGEEETIYVETREFSEFKFAVLVQRACADKWGIRLSGSTEGEKS